MTVTRSSNTFSEINVGEEGVQFSNTKDPGSITPTESIIDGDFANWDTAFYPDGWGMWDAVNDGTPNPTGWDRSTDSQAGTYALELTANIDAGGGYVSAALTGFYDTAVAEKTIQARFYAKYTTGTPSLGVLTYYWDGVNDYVWDITSGTWMIDGTEDNGLEIVAITDSYTQVTSTQRTLPAGATEFWFDIVVVGNQNDVALLDNVEWLLDGADVATNGTMEAWTEYANPFSPLSSWSFAAGANWGFDSIDPTDSSHIIRGTDTQTGTYAAEFLVKNSGNGERGFIYQTITASAGTSVDLSVYTKTSDAQTPYLICLDGVEGAMTQQYDFVADIWDTQGTSPTDLPGTSNAKTLSGTTSYVENTHTVTVPASGTLVVVLMTDDGDDGAGYTYKFDTASGIASIVAGGVQIQQFPFKTQSNIADFQNNDRLVEFVASGNPADKILVLEVADNARPELDIEWLSDMPGVHNLENLDLYIAAPTENYNPATKLYTDTAVAAVPTTTISLLATKTGIDLTSATSQTLSYTVPTGYKLLVDNLKLEATTVTNFTSAVGAELRFGTDAPDYERFLTTVNEAPTTVGHIKDYKSSITVAARQYTAVAGETLYITINGAWTADALLCTAYVFGTLLAV